MKILLFLLFLLKIIGIILLCALVLILLVLGIILLVPIRYEVKANNTEELFVDAKVSWLIKLVYLKYKIDKNKKIFKYRFFWKTNKNHKKEKKKHNINEINKNVQQETYTETYTQQQEDNEQKLNKENAENFKKKSNKFDNKQIKKVKKTKDTNKNKKSKSRKSEKVNSIFKDIKDVLNKIKKFPNKKVIFQKVIEFLKHLLKHILPEDYELNVVFGLEDPASTGYVLGIISVILPFVDRNHNIKLKGNFENKQLKGEFYAKGRIYLGYIAFITIKLLIDKTIRHTIKALRTGQVNYDN